MVSSVVVQLLSHVRLCEPMDCGRPGSAVHRSLQARILEWVAISCSRVSSWPRDQAQVSCIGSQILYHRPSGKSWFQTRFLQITMYWIYRLWFFNHFSYEQLSIAWSRVNNIGISFSEEYKFFFFQLVIFKCKGVVSPLYRRNICVRPTSEG